jgi:hypothetical protein
MTGDESKVVRPLSVEFAGICLVARWATLGELDDTDFVSYEDRD